MGVKTKNKNTNHKIIGFETCRIIIFKTIVATTLSKVCK